MSLLLNSTVILSIVCFARVSSVGKFETVYQWRWVDYLWDTQIQQTVAILTGEYNFSKSVIIDVDVWKDGRTFVTVIRSQGVPSSLNVISDKNGPGGPLLKPYPNWAWTEKGNCDAITNVYRVAIDECDRLWVLDTGKIDEETICPAQLLAFDLNTDELVRRVRIPRYLSENSATKRGLLVTPIVESKGQHCERTHVYLADVTGNGLIVYNGTAVWRLDSPVFEPQQSASYLTIANVTFYLNDGILGMALSPKSEHRSRYLMFRPLASFDMIATNTEDLQTSYESGFVRYTFASHALPSQAAAMAFSADGALFFGLTRDLGIACWHMDRPITRKNIVIVDDNPDAYPFVSGVKVLSPDVTGSDEEVWIATIPYQKIVLEKQNFNAINFRIMRSSVKRLVENTNCSPRSRLKFLWSYNYNY